MCEIRNEYVFLWYLSSTTHILCGIFWLFLLTSAYFNQNPQTYKKIIIIITLPGPDLG